MNRTLIFCFALALALSACGEASPLVPPGTCVLEHGRLAGDVTLRSECRSLRVVEDLVVKDGHTLTIAPGTTLVFDPGVALVVGEGSPGRLVALGTPARPIRFVSTPDATSASTAWGGIRFAGGTLPGSVVGGAIVQGGGASTGACVHISKVPDDALRIADVALVECAGAGLLLDAGRVPIEGLTFEDVPLGVRVTPSSVRDLRQTDLSKVVANVLIGGVVEVDTTIHDTGSTWRVDGDLVVQGDAAPTLTIEAGARLAFESGRWLAVGNDDLGGLSVLGTSAERVRFTSSSSAAGGWHGIVLGPQTTAATFEHASIAEGGGEGVGVNGCLSIDVRRAAIVKLEGVTIERCMRAGIAATENAELSFAEGFDVTLRASPVGLQLGASVLGSVPGGLSFDDVPYNVVLGGTVVTDATWSAQSIPWRVTKDIRVRGPERPTLTLGAGLTLGFATDRWIEVGMAEPGALIAEGRVDEPVVLRAVAEGTWRGIVFGRSLAQRSRLSFVELSGAGAAGPNVTGCLSILDDRPDRLAIEDTRLEGCGQAAISAPSNGFAFSSFTRNTIVDTTTGLSLAPSAVASVGADNAYEGVEDNRILSGAVERSGHWAPNPLGYRVLGPLVVDGADEPVLSLGADLVLRFDSDAHLTVGSDRGGALWVGGASSNRVMFTSSAASPAPGDWAGLRFGPATQMSRIDGARVAFAGQASPKHSGGITLDRTGAAVSITSSSFGSNELADVFVDCGSKPQLGDNNYGSPNGLVFESNCAN